jgi:hypothetical protein
MFFQALDTFTAPVLGFEGDILIPAVSISTRTPSIDSVDDSSVGPSIGSSRTLVGKRKAAATPPKKKNPWKAMNKKASGVKINNSAPNPSSAPTPPKNTHGRFNMRRSNKQA